MRRCVCPLCAICVQILGRKHVLVLEENGTWFCQILALADTGTARFWQSYLQILVLSDACAVRYLYCQILMMLSDADDVKYRYRKILVLGTVRYW